MVYRKSVLLTLLACFVFFVVACTNIEEPPSAIESPTPEPTPSKQLPTPELTPEPTPSKQLPTAEPAATVPPSYTPVFQETECRFTYRSSSEIRCGDLIVPENRANPVHGITIHVAIISSRSDTPKPDPLVFLSGGPGGYTLDFTDEYIVAFNDILKERDLILFDQRGVGHSTPSLDCPELVDVERANRDVMYANFSAGRELMLEGWQACRDRLASDGIDLSAYHSAAIVADLEDLFSLLDYEAWNLYGISYGGRLALTAMREEEQKIIRSVVLDSPLPPHIDTLSEMGANTAGIFDLVFERCAAYEPCGTAYPSLSEDFYTLVNKLNEEPITLRVNDFANQETFLRPLNGDDFIDVLFDMMYSHYEIKYIPQIITHLEDGRTQRVSTMLGRLLSQREVFSEGMAMSVLCAEEYPYVEEQVLNTRLKDLPDSIRTYAQTHINFSRDVCDIWGIEPQTALETEPVKSDTPTLIMTGDYDPITPPNYAQSAASYLSQAHYIEFAWLSHGIITSSRCSKEITTFFLNDPASYPASDCIEPRNLGFATQ